MNNVENIGANVKFGAGAETLAKVNAVNKVKQVYHFEAFDPAGNLKWVADACNIVTLEGLDDVLDKYLKGSAYTAAHFVLLTDGTPTVAGADTLAVHAGWAEVADYTGNRQPLVLGAVASQAVDNSASKASFVMTADNVIIGGAGLATVDTGTAGILYSVAPFTAADKQLDTGDTLNVTVTATAATA